MSSLALRRADEGSVWWLFRLTSGTRTGVRVPARPR